jgi:hypothetical protein
MERKLKVKPTPRGFMRGEFKDHNRAGCSIQESSEIGDGYLWLGVNDPNPKIFPGDSTGWHPYPLPENVHCTTRMHLDRKTVKKLLPLLQKFVKTGRLS